MNKDMPEWFIMAGVPYVRADRSIDMAKFWFKRILAGKATIDDVPERWRDSVQMMLNEAAKQDKTENE